MITFCTTSFIVNNIIYNKIIKYYYKLNENKNITEKIDYKKINLLIGHDEKRNIDVYIPENGLYQNFLITGTIGTGKTSSAMYPFTKQIMEYNFKNYENKIGMLILDVKGNYFSQVKKYAKKFNLENDLIVLELKSNIKYNPLHKPRIKTTDFS